MAISDSDNTELSSELLRLVDGLVTGVTVELQGLEGDTVVTIGVRPGSLRSELLRLKDGVELTVGRQGPEGDTLTSVVTLEEDGSFWVHDVDTDNIYVGWDVECVMKHMNAGGYTVSSLTTE